MGELAERIVLKDLQEERRIRQEEVALQNQIAQENRQEVSVLLVPYRNIYNEWFWKFISYTYFICRTLGLLILIDIFIFGRPHAILFIFILLYCCYLNLKLYRYISRKNTKASI